jgi:hypothetical protein
MIIRLQNPLTALVRHKTPVERVKSAPVTYQQKLMYDRLVIGVLILLSIGAPVLYHFLYSA